MKGYRQALEVLPAALRRYLLQIPTSQAMCVQEIRLRAGQPVTVTARGRSLYLSEKGELSQAREGAVYCCREWLENAFDAACEYSVYAHQEELRQGFITVKNGCRIGVAGTAVIKDGAIATFRDVDSLCLRVAREHHGCARELVSEVYDGERLHSVLICGEPSCGKSSLLKDLVRQLSQRHVYPCVIDERGELHGTAAMCGCDVLRYVRKTQGIEQAVRCLAPPLLILDELGSEAEIEAVAEGLYRGVPAVATVHCTLPEQLLKRRALRRALRNGVFERLVFLEGRARPGVIYGRIKTEEWLCERAGDFTAVVDGDGNWCDGVASLTTASEGVGGVSRARSAVFATHSLCGGADDGIVL